MLLLAMVVVLAGLGAARTASTRRTPNSSFEFLGQEYRVSVALGIDCDTLCTMPFPAPYSYQEVPVKHLS